MSMDFDDTPTTEFFPTTTGDETTTERGHWDGILDEWYRGEMDTRAESPRARKR